MYVFKYRKDSWYDVLTLLSDGTENAICASTYSQFEIFSVPQYTYKNQMHGNIRCYVLVTFIMENKNAFLENIILFKIMSKTNIIIHRNNPNSTELTILASVLLRDD